MVNGRVASGKVSDVKSVPNQMLLSAVATVWVIRWTFLFQNNYYRNVFYFCVYTAKVIICVWRFGLFITHTKKLIITSLSRSHLQWHSKQNLSVTLPLTWEVECKQFAVFSLNLGCVLRLAISQSKVIQSINTLLVLNQFSVLSQKCIFFQHFSKLNNIFVSILVHKHVRLTWKPKIKKTQSSKRIFQIILNMLNRFPSPWKHKAQHRVWARSL